MKLGVLDSVSSIVLYIPERKSLYKNALEVQEAELIKLADFFASFHFQSYPSQSSSRKADDNILNLLRHGSHVLLVLLLLLQVHGVVEQTAGDFEDGIVVVFDKLGFVDKEAAKSDLISIRDHQCLVRH